MFPLIQLPRKSEDWIEGLIGLSAIGFPLIQLPRKSEEEDMKGKVNLLPKVSINSTSEEVRRGPQGIGTSPQSGFH